jgi:hypothetical protein
VDFLIQRLEQLSPQSMSQEMSASESTSDAQGRLVPPMHGGNLGLWKLLYASNGTSNRTNVLASVLHIVAQLPGTGIGTIAQDVRRTAANSETIVLENSVILGMGACLNLFVQSSSSRDSPMPKSATGDMATVPN